MIKKSIYYQACIMWCICCIKVLVNELWPIRFEYSTALWYNDELQATQVPKNTVHNTHGLFFVFFFVLWASYLTAHSNPFPWEKTPLALTTFLLVLTETQFQYTSLLYITPQDRCLTLLRIFCPISWGINKIRWGYSVDFYLWRHSNIKRWIIWYPLVM